MKVDLTEMPLTPEADKMLKIHDESQAIGEFLDWLPTIGIHLAKWEYCEERDRNILFMSCDSITDLLAQFFDIDLKKVDQEQEAVLAYVRSQAKH